MLRRRSWVGGDVMKRIIFKLVHTIFFLFQWLDPHEKLFFVLTDFCIHGLTKSYVEDGQSSIRDKTNTKNSLNNVLVVVDETTMYTNKRANDSVFKMLI